MGNDVTDKLQNLRESLLRVADARGPRYVEKARKDFDMLQDAIQEIESLRARLRDAERALEEVLRLLPGNAPASRNWTKKALAALRAGDSQADREGQ